MAEILLIALFTSSLVLEGVFIVMLLALLLRSPSRKKAAPKVKEDLGKIKRQINGEEEE